MLYLIGRKGKTMNPLSFKFIAFVAIVFIFSWLTRGKFRKIVLLVSNFVFLLSFGNNLNIIYLLIIALYSFAVARIIRKKESSQLLVIISPIVLGLVFFKVVGLFDFSNIIMPLGISFYTFKVISYLVDVYRGTIEVQINLFDYLIYVSFFPCFTAGPINRSKPFFEQLKTMKTFNYESCKSGAFLCACGMFEKIVIADYFSIIVNNILSNQELTGIYVIFAMILYSFQIYIDFDAYSNIAIGISKMLGFDISRNFYTPYLATSIREFWRRWHISLSTWFRDYVYIPLGGNRKGATKKMINTIIVFTLSGLWHGSSLAFAIWGLGHAMLMIIEELIEKKFAVKIKNLPLKYVLNVVKIIVNFALVTVLWVFFRSANFLEAMLVFQKAFTPMGFSIDKLGITMRELYWIVILIMGIILTDICRNKTNMVTWFSKRNVVIRWTIYTIMICVVIVFGIYGTGYNPSDFIYKTF